MLKIIKKKNKKILYGDIEFVIFKNNFKFNNIYYYLRF